MRKLIVFLITVLINTAAFSQDSFVIGGENLDLYEDYILPENSIIEAVNLNIKNSLYLQNLGEISSDIFICDVCQLKLQNSGVINSVFNMGNNSKLTQVIKTNADISEIGAGDFIYSVLVQNVETINFSDLIDISGAADKIILDNASVSLIGNNEMSFISPEIELIGEIKVNIDNSDELDGSVILSNVSGDGVVNLNVQELGPLYIAKAIRRDDNIYVSIYRETDYQKVLGGSRGIFINNLRVSSPNNPTLVALDRAGSIYDLYGVMERSVALNPINLMIPIKIFNNFEINSPRTIYNSNGFDAFYVSSGG
ncbi:MAG: hypothetical protein JW974_02600 [Alphaproteobacteria bacterium]|nr:hypothetical protein [Alphaproteobacteria bacterium]MBN2675186.1 hypothetical protein [Alphaproteobacteria bacterium]